MTPTINLTVNVSTPEAAEAVLRALGAVAPAAQVAVPAPAELAPVPPAPVSVPVSVPAPAVPVAAAPVAPAAAPVQAPPPPAAVPVAPAPTYSREQIMTAGAALIDGGKMDELMGLLNAFGVQAVSQLKQERLGAFATELRKLGARI